MNRNWWIVLIVAVLSLCFIICACILFAVLLGVVSSTSYPAEGGSGEFFQITPTSTPVLIRPTPGAGDSGSGFALQGRTGEETLEILRNTKVPVNDLRDLAHRLEGIDDIPLTLEGSAIPLSLGTEEEFWVSNVDTNESFQIRATLQSITDHAYFWIGEEVDFDEDDLARLADTFERKIYPTNRAFFGSEWSPGVDGDPHLYILLVDGLGLNLLGYFSSADEQHPLAHQFSNAHEMFLLNADNLDLGDEGTYGVLAHELQHMIHWNQDRNESTWVNEGFSELAVLLNGYEVGSDFAYIQDPDIQLNDWPNDQGDTVPHYGAAFLFLTYFLDRLGEEATRALVTHPENGFEGIDEILRDIGAITTEDLFVDWVLASYLGDENISDGRYAYSVYPDAPKAGDTETISDCPLAPATRDVSQYGVDYIRITCQGNYQLSFQGSTLARLVPADPHSGDYVLWSNKGDESDMTLTREFDFSDYSGPLTLSFWTWFDLEEDYDYAYLVVSEDGEHWDILTTPSGTVEDPSGNSFGWGYNGRSSGWVQERVDLSDYAGKKIQIRFEYVTDAAVNGEGMLIDDIAIPETGYFTDFEGDAGGWSAEGWVRIQNVLPQTFRLAWITLGDSTSVDYIALEPDGTAEIRFDLDDGREAVFVVSGTTRFTRQKAAYQFEITP